jgi:hypothetical protein
MPRMLDANMQRLIQAPNLAIATLWVDVLALDGVSASVQRHYLGGVAGQLPPDQCLPEVWVHEDAQLPQARQRLSELQRTPQHRWFCACGELVEGGFEACWNCGVPMPA